MQPTEAAQVDPAARVAPSLGTSAPWRVVRVEPLAGSRLAVTFVDGTEGEVDLAGFLAAQVVVGSVFEPLRDPTEFRRVGLSVGVVTWPSGADLAPDAMYDSIRAEGRWVVEP